MKLDDEVYARLLAMRVSLRRFERWSADQARAAGLTPTQHQLLLAIRGHDDPRGPTTRELAEYLLLQHHSTVGLIDRAEAAGLVNRTRTDEDHRVVRLHLTTAGAQCLDGLSAAHLEEITRLAPYLPVAWDPAVSAPVESRVPVPDAPAAASAVSVRWLQGGPPLV